MNIDAALALLACDRSATREEIQKQYQVRSRFMHPDRFADRPAAEKELASEEFKRLTLARDTLIDSWGSWNTSGIAGRPTASSTSSASASAGRTGARGPGASASGAQSGSRGHYRSSQHQQARSGPAPQRGADIEKTIFVDARVIDQGESIQVTTGVGSVRVRIPKGMALGGKLRVRERGLPGINGGRPGDLYVWVEAKAPVHSPYRAGRSHAPRSTNGRSRQRARSSSAVWLWSIVGVAVLMVVAAIGLNAVADRAAAPSADTQISEFSFLAPLDAECAPEQTCWIFEVTAQTSCHHAWATVGLYVTESATDPVVSRDVALSLTANVPAQLTVVTQANDPPFAAVDALRCANTSG